MTFEHDCFERAASEHVSVLLSDTDFVRIRTGKSESSHVLTTDGSDAPSCSCPADHYNSGKCKHRIAWEEWLVDEVRFSDGELAWSR